MSTGTKRHREPSTTTPSTLPGNGSRRSSGRLQSLRRAVARALTGRKKVRVQPDVSDEPKSPIPDLASLDLYLEQLKYDQSESTPYVEMTHPGLDIPLHELNSTSLCGRDTPSLHDQNSLNDEKVEKVEERKNDDREVHRRNSSGRSYLTYITKDSGYETEDQVTNSLPLPFHPKDKSSAGSSRCRQMGHDFPSFPDFGDPCIRCGVSPWNYLNFPDENARLVQQNPFDDAVALSAELDQIGLPTLGSLFDTCDPRGCSSHKIQIISDETRGNDASLLNYGTISQDDLDGAASSSEVSNDLQCSRSTSEDSLNTDGAESGNDDEQLVLVIARHRLLQRLMQEFYSMLSSFLTETPQDSPGNSTESAHTTSQKDNGKSTQKNATRTRKRRFERDDENMPEDDESEDRKKRTSRSAAADRDGRLFACPFYKYDPRKYTCTNSTRTKYRSCAGPGFDLIACLKQHLKRNHSAPIQCLRCWQVFLDQTALATHSRSENLCQVLPLEVVEGISQQKFDRMKKWGSTWNEIFAIIFPGAPLPECCYHDFEPPNQPEGPPSPSSQDLADYEAYARTELPRLVEATLEALIQAETEPLEEKLKPLLVDVVRSCQSTLGHRWSMIKGASAAPAATPYRLLAANIERQTPQGSTMETQRVLEPWGPSPDVIAAPAIIEASYQEPRLLGLEESNATAAAFKKSFNLQKPSVGHQRASDSGYWSLASEDLCRCDQFFDFSFDVAKQSDVARPPPFSGTGIPHHTVSMTDLRSEDKHRSRCEICCGLLSLASSATE